MLEQGQLVEQDKLVKPATTAVSRPWETLPVLLLLILAVLMGSSEFVHARLLQLGEWLWEDYFILRGDIPTPSCDPQPNIEQRLDQLAAEAALDADPLGLFEVAAFDREAARHSLQQAAKLCVEQHATAAANQARVTPGVEVFRQLEAGVAVWILFTLEQQRIGLLLLLFVCAWLACRYRHHIAFRPVESQLDYRVCISAQLVTHSLLLGSSWWYRQSVYNAGVVEHPLLLAGLLLGFAALVGLSAYQLLRMPADLVAGGRWPRALLSVPLYCIMGVVAAFYFLWIEGHAGGLAIFFSQLFEHSLLFLQVSLYLWTGMLLRQTQLGQRVFALFQPLGLPAELLAVVAVLVMALPTAFTGASGIIILATGAVVYDELRRLGARRQLALATTAMTGSAGVVLRPCLLVVLIAALNKEVVTEQLYTWGGKVFALTMLVFLLLVFITRRQPWRPNFSPAAWRASLNACRPLLPYVVILGVALLLYGLLLRAYLDEFAAPVILPVVMLLILAYERRKAAKEQSEAASGFGHAVTQATQESCVHIGALLTLMGLSFAVGGVIERSGMLHSLPSEFASVWVAMALLVLMLVVIGMVMDPFGAVVLVSGSLAQLAYANGIDPVHFWMVALVAFELGYLSPPVALNHLLTRQVVGESEVAAARQDGQGFWYRHERMLLPLAVLGLVLMLVAWGPLV